MRPTQLILRCYAERDEDLWVAVCLDLSLAAQGDTFDEAKDKLDHQIKEYVLDAVAGPDKRRANYLLRHRRAPASEWVKYYLIKAVVGAAKLLHRSKPQAKPFHEVMPLVPASC